MASKKTIRQIVSPMDLMLVVGILQRIFRRNEEVSEFLYKLDEPHEIDRLYGALEVLIGLVKDDKDVDDDTVEGGVKDTKGSKVIK